MHKFNVGDKIIDPSVKHSAKVTAVGETRYLIKGDATGLEYGSNIQVIDTSYELAPNFFEEGKTYRDPESYSLALRKDSTFEVVANYVDPEGVRVAFGWWRSATFGGVKGTTMDQNDFDNFEELR